MDGEVRADLDASPVGSFCLRNHALTFSSHIEMLSRVQTFIVGESAMDFGNRPVDSHRAIVDLASVVRALTSAIRKSWFCTRTLFLRF